MDSLKQKIFKAMETNTLVFSSQIVADSYVYAYAREYGSSFKDRAISWDRFKQQFTDIPSDLKEADDIDRRLFVKRWSKENPQSFQKLKYFANFSYQEAIPAFERSITQVVSQLAKAYGNSKSIKEDLYDCNPPTDLISDIHILVPAYRQYLIEHKLYDINFFEPDFSKAGDYVLVFPQTFKDPQVQNAVLYCKCIEITIHDTAEEDLFKGFGVYNNSVSEIRGTMRNIRNLMEEGVLPSDIAISCADLKSYRPYLEHEAHIRDINLEFQDSEKLSQTPPGRYLKTFIEARKNGWNYRFLRSLILDPMTPFKDRDIYPYLISCANRLKINVGDLQRWEAKLKRNSDEPDRFATEEDRINNRLAFEAFVRLKNAINGFEGLLITDKPSEAIMTFSKSVLTDNYWTSQNNEIPQGPFAAVFGSCIDELKKLENKAEDLKHEEILDMFRDIIESVSYLENRKTMGLKVYSYPVSCGLCLDHHFVLNLSDKAVSCYRDAYPFLTDRNNSRKTDIGHEILKTYLLSGSVLSGCEESFSGPNVLPTDFLEKGRNIYKKKEKDSFDKEGLEKSVMPDNQKKGYEKNRDVCSNYSCKEVFQSPELPFELSISKIKDFEACPYKVYASSVLKLKEACYELNMEDPAAVGDILHRTVQNALKEAKSIKKISLKRLNDILKYEVYQVYASRNDAPEKQYLDRIYKTYEDLIGEFINVGEALEGYEFDSMESDTKGTVQIKNVLYTGRADLVLKNGKGDYAVIDLKKDDSKYYKAKSLEKTSLQVAMYATLLKDNPSFGRTPAFGAYYSFANGKLHAVWPKGGYGNDWEIDTVEEDRETRLQAISDKILEGNFKPQKDIENCKNCPFKTLCRGGFEIK